MTMTADVQSTYTAAGLAASDNVLVVALQSPLIDAMVDLDHLMEKPLSPRGPLTRRQLSYRLIRNLSQHTAAVQSQLYPKLATAEGGVNAIARDRELNRTLLLQLRQLRGLLQGDHHARLDQAEVARRLLATLQNVLSHRMQWLPTFSAPSSDDLRILTQRLRSAQVHAPSRPHPYTPTGGLSGRVSQRLWAVVDGVMDECDSQA